MYVLIPAYQPDEKMLKLITDLKEQTPYRILVVDDGSSADRMGIFSEAEKDAVVLHHEVNMGKGAAIKTGLSYIREHCEPNEGIVTVDADGQHLIHDIIRVCDDWAEHPEALVLGSRRFTGNVPFKSRTGNAITRFVFHISTGVKVYDTQTGLRAFGADRIDTMIDMRGNRYEYEINVLLYSTRLKIPIREVTIDTVYIEENKSSHFHPFRDSWRIYKMIFVFVGSSLAATLIDLLLFKLLRWIFPQFGQLFAEITARLVSSFCNYLINKKLVFEGKGTSDIARYYLVAVLILGMDYGLLYLFSNILHIPELLAKMMAGLICYPISFFLQRIFVFKFQKRDSK